MRIGIGVTTYKRPKTLSLTMRQFAKHTKETEGVEFCYHVQHFYPLKHKGIAEVKNLCIKALMEQDCDFIYLFDDDCFPIHPEWWKPFVEAHLRTGQHHFLWLKEEKIRSVAKLSGAKLIKEENGITVFKNAQGCCIFLTKYAVMAAGGFDERFKGYGYEHENYSLRIHQLGMNTMGAFLSVPDIELYIYSLDVLGPQPYASQLGKEYEAKTGLMKSTRSNADLRKSLDKNHKLFHEPSQVYIPL